MGLDKFIEQAGRQFVRDNLMSDEFIDFIQENRRLFRTVNAICQGAWKALK